MTLSDIELIREFARTGSEQAFRALVARHVNLVYSVALRQVRDSHLAEEITQTVFIILARKAASLGASTIVSAWLCRTARYASAKALTLRQRRLHREHHAYLDSLSGSPETPDTAETWSEIAPLLDSALAELARKDHDAIVIRFFEQRSFKDVAAALGSTEPAAKMRVTRALEKLRGIFAKRGVRLPATVIAAAVAAHSVQAAPAGLAASAATAASSGAAASSSAFLILETTLKHMTLTKIKTAAFSGALALLTVGTGLIVHQSFAQPAAASVPANYQTPEAALETLIRALQAADTAKFAEGCTPERAAVFNARNEGKSPEELRREAEGMAKAFAKFKIVSRNTVSDTEVHLRIQAQGDKSQAQPGDTDTLIRFKKIGPHWKFDGHVQ